MLRRISSESGDLRRLDTARPLSFSGSIRRARPPARKVAAYIVTSSLIMTCAAAPWVLALRHAPVETILKPTAQGPADLGSSQSSAQTADMPTSKAIGPSSIARTSAPPSAERVQPPGSIEADTRAPDRAAVQRPPEVGQIPVGEVAPSVATRVTSTIVNQEAEARDEKLALREALLVPPVLVPTLGPGRVLQARSPVVVRRTVQLPPIHAPLRPSRAPADVPAAEQTASVTSLPKVPRARIDTGAAVKASLHRARDEPDPRPRLPEQPKAPWKLPSILAPTD